MVIVATFLLRLYDRDYVSAVCFGMFILVAAPETIQIRIDATLPSITIHRVVIVLMLFKCIGRTTGANQLTNAPFWRLLLIIAGCYSISTIFSDFFVVSLKSYLNYMIETVGCFWVVFTSVRSREDAGRLLKSIGLGFVVVSVFAFFERYFGFKIHDFFPREFDSSRFFWVSGDSGDITATYAHRILLGVACALGALKQILDLTQSRNWRNTRWPLVQALICIAALYFSMSRGPWLAFLLGFAVMAIFVGGKAVKWGAVFGIVSLLLVLIRPGVGTTIANLYSSTFDPYTVKGGSYEWRFIIMKTAINEMVKAGPFQSLFGFGGGSQIMKDFGTYEIYPGIRLPIRSWDCEYAVVLYERGIIGIVLYTYLGISVLVLISRKMKTSGNGAKHAALIYCFVGLAVLLFAKTNVAIYAPQLAYVEACLLGISSRLISWRHEYEGSVNKQ